MEALDLDQSLRDSVTGLVSALGGIEYSQPGHPYVLGDDALGCLKDLKKWVKFYGSSSKLDALRCIADTNLVSLDICQILGQFKEGQEDDKAKCRLALNCRNTPSNPPDMISSGAAGSTHMADRTRPPSCGCNAV